MCNNQSKSQLNKTEQWQWFLMSITIVLTNMLQISRLISASSVKLCLWHKYLYSWHNMLWTFTSFERRKGTKYNLFTTFTCKNHDVFLKFHYSKIHNHSNSFVGVDQVQLANFLYELLMIRDTILALSSNVHFSKAKLEDIITLLCSQLLSDSCL